jgi:hypothetical protein
VARDYQGGAEGASQDISKFDCRVS